MGRYPPWYGGKIIVPANPNKGLEMSMMSSFQLDVVKGLIAKDKLNEAVEELLALGKGSKFYDEIIGVSGHYHRLKNDEVKGFGVEYSEFSKVRFSLLELINQINQDELSKNINRIDNDNEMSSSKDTRNYEESCLYQLIYLMDEFDTFLSSGKKQNANAAHKLKRFANPNTIDSLDFASNILKLTPGELFKAKNENINFLEGQWNSKWNREIDLIFGVKMGNNSSEWYNGKGNIFFEDGWVIMQFKDYRYEYLIRAKQFGKKIIGRYMNCQNRNDNTPWFGEIRDNNSIDGIWALGQWNFWR